ncbi:MAG: MBL fold metallo-hydrolase [Myxococcota bacterium]
MRIVVLGSGSQGNATVFESGGTRVLVDAGLSVRATRTRYREATGDDLGSLDALVLTHAHGDHVQHAKSVAAAYECPVHLQERTARQVELPEAARRVTLRPQASFGVGELRIGAVAVPHDEAQVALIVGDGADEAALVTDLGHIPASLPRALRDVRTLLLEANHDPQLLAMAPYPASVRARVGGRYGHLANAQAAGLLRRLGRALERVVLMHLSQSNNTPRKAREAVRDALRPGVRLEVAAQDAPLVLTGSAPAKQLALF